MKTIGIWSLSAINTLHNLQNTSTLVFYKQVTFNGIKYIELVSARALNKLFPLAKHEIMNTSNKRFGIQQCPLPNFGLCACHLASLHK